MRIKNLLPYMIKKVIILFILSIYFVGSSCQNNMNQYLTILKNICENPDIIGIEKKQHFVEIEYLCEGKVFEIAIDHNDKVLYIENEIDESQISPKIFKKLKNEFPGWSIDEYSLINLNDTSVIKVEIMKDGIERNIYFSLSGKLYENNVATNNNNWNTKSLKGNINYKTLNYNIFSPNSRHIMPDLLREISGIAIDESGTVYCVQDELASVFAVDLKKNEISNTYRFSDIGDYEDLVYKDGKIYVLRSDGRVINFDLKKFPSHIKENTFAFQSLNIEGMCYDSNQQKMIFASREENINSAKNQKYIQSATFGKKNNLKTLFIINVDSIEQALLTNYPEIIEKNIDFSPSAIAVHPLTGDYYILSANQRMLAIYSKDLLLRSLYPLPSDVFYKPEGLTFTREGTMLISNEGSKNGLIKANILVFEPLKKSES